MMKVVMKLDFADDKIKLKALQKISGISGIVSIAVDAKDKKLTVTGDIDPVSMVAKLRKICRAEIVSVGPAKEPEKKKEVPKKEEPKKEDPKTKEAAKEDSAQLIKAYHAYYQQNPYYQQPPVAVPAYFNRSVEENPNGCVIC